VLPLTPYYKNKNRENLSKKKNFKLKADADLPQNKSPMIRDKAFTITIKLASAGTEGVLVAQGGSAAGYALYVKDGKLWFAQRRQGKIFSISGQLPVSSERLVCQLTRKGAVTVRSGGRLLLSGDVPGTQDTMPLDGLQVGRDVAGHVGDYGVTDEFPYDGKIEQVQIRIE
jgi:arylsulfatase